MVAVAWGADAGAELGAATGGDGAKTGGISCALAMPGSQITDNAKNSAERKPDRERCMSRPRLGTRLIEHNGAPAAILPYCADT